MLFIFPAIVIYIWLVQLVIVRIVYSSCYCISYNILWHYGLFIFHVIAIYIQLAQLVNVCIVPTALCSKYTFCTDNDEYLEIKI